MLRPVTTSRRASCHDPARSPRAYAMRRPTTIAGTSRTATSAGMNPSEGTPAYAATACAAIKVTAETDP